MESLDIVHLDRQEECFPREERASSADARRVNRGEPAWFCTFDAGDDSPGDARPELGIARSSQADVATRDP